MSGFQGQGVLPQGGGWLATPVLPDDVLREAVCLVPPRPPAQHTRHLPSVAAALPWSLSEQAQRSLLAMLIWVLPHGSRVVPFRWLHAAGGRRKARSDSLPRPGRRCRVTLGGQSTSWRSCAVSLPTSSSAWTSTRCRPAWPPRATSHTTDTIHGIAHSPSTLLTLPTCGPFKNGPLVGRVQMHVACNKSYEASVTGALWLLALG